MLQNLGVFRRVRATSAVLERLIAYESRKDAASGLEVLCVNCPTLRTRSGDWAERVYVEFCLTKLSEVKIQKGKV